MFICVQVHARRGQGEREREHGVSLQITLSEATSSTKEQCLATT